MKAQRVKGVADIKADKAKAVILAAQEAEMHRRFAPTTDPEAYFQRFIDEQTAKTEAASYSPETARATKQPYTGSDMSDKGKRDGSCNVRACQMPLAGKPQYVIKSTDHYYCEDCARRFNSDNVNRNEPPRCTPV